MSTVQSEKKWYVYLLCDPDTEVPFYVGKGTGNRINQHERSWKSNCNEQKKQVIRDILASGKEVLKKKIAEFESEQDAYIYEWGTANMYHGQITNVRPCGHGRPSRPQEGQEAAERTRCEPLWTIEETAAYLHIPVSEVMHQKGLGYVPLNKKNPRFIPETVREYLASKTAS